MRENTRDELLREALQQQLSLDAARTKTEPALSHTAEPFARAHGETERGGPNTAPHAWAGRRVLVLDGNDVRAGLLAERLKQWGLRVETAASVAQGIQRAQEAARSGDGFRLALVDQRSVALDAADFARAVKAMPEAHPIHLVLLVSWGSQSEAALLRELGFTTFIEKPIASAQLRAVLQSATASDAAAEKRPSSAE
ncbi:MAG TPA: response regulator [Candidatus Hydrogenedentes bacterium]|nr:response regulator [Candidatus Hydrogenedentota bacterium]